MLLQDHAGLIEIVIDQKNHTLDLRVVLVARSFSQAASVPDFGGCAAIWVCTDNG